MKETKNYPIRYAIHCLVSVLFGLLLIYLSLNTENHRDIPQQIGLASLENIKTSQKKLTLLLGSEQSLSFSEFDIKQPKYRKKFPRIVDSTINIEPIEAHIVQSRYSFNDLQISYQSPYFYSQQHSFLHRLTYF